MSPATLNYKYLLNISFKPVKGSEISKFLYDAKRFILSYYSITDSSPLQLYSSALIFAPKESIIRNTFHDYIPDWILQEPNTDLEWNAVIQTLEGHGNWIHSIAFSADLKLLASASRDHTIKIWDATTGILQQTLEGHSDSVRSIAFSADSKLLASASRDHTIKIWDTATNTLQQTLKGHSDWVNSVAFSADSKLLASTSHDHTIKIWDAAIGNLQQTLEGHSGSVRSVAFSADSKLLASASRDHTIKIWDIVPGTLQQTFKRYSKWVNSIAFSTNSKLLASASDDHAIKIWDTATGTLQHTLDDHIGARNLSFDITNSILITDIGCFRLNINSNIPLPSSSRAIDSRSHRQGLSIDESWVIWNDQNLLWLPPDFRPEIFTISHTGSKLAIGCPSGRVFIIGIDDPYNNNL
ncbi:hypothetical protein BTUL_0433g00010 [Botrytis tulipae]|uniref:Uncharacterized protein n=1 Tax=Botrytis tulipae TaxID=87230 RepID=A0A4Z1E4C7_9HELO|nr:hypothetical protein BTUL_0433g00010 [Botrytis tulipae]